MHRGTKAAEMLLGLQLAVRLAQHLGPRVLLLVDFLVRLLLPHLEAPPLVHPLHPPPLGQARPLPRLAAQHQHQEDLADLVRLLHPPLELHPPLAVLAAALSASLRLVDCLARQHQRQEEFSAAQHRPLRSEVSLTFFIASLLPRDFWRSNMVAVNQPTHLLGLSSFPPYSAVAPAPAGGGAAAGRCR